jgi:phage tail-like protein
MDANGLRFWLLAEGRHWQLEGNPAQLQYDSACHSLRLANERTLPVWNNRWALQITGADGSESGLFYFTVRPRTTQSVQITQVLPVTLEIGDRTLTINGIGFHPEMELTVFFPDGRLTTLTADQFQSITATQLSLSLSLEQPGPWGLRVGLPDGTTSERFYFTVWPAPDSTQPAPSLRIVSLDPTLPALDSPVSLTVDGTGFQAEMRVEIIPPIGEPLVLSGEAIQLVNDSQLRMQVTLPGPSLGTDQLNQPAQAIDAFGTRAYWNDLTGEILATGAMPPGVEDEPIYPLGTAQPDGNITPPNCTDLAMGYDGVLYGVIANQVILIDRRNRWKSTPVTQAGFAAWKLAAMPTGGVWVLGQFTPPEGQSSYRLAQITGLPRPTPATRDTPPDVFCSCDTDSGPRLVLQAQSPIPGEEQPVAISCSPEGILALLSWRNGNGRIRCFDTTGTLLQTLDLVDAIFPYSLTWVERDRLAVLLPHLFTEAPVYALPSPQVGITQVRPVGDLYPLRGHQGQPFLNGITLPPHYLSQNGSVPLYPLSLPTYVRRGVATNQLQCDSGSSQTVWHRLYLEASIPPTCGIQVWLAASDAPTPTADTVWFEHRFGQRFAPGDGVTPRGVWVKDSSEVPFHPGLYRGDPEPNQSGLFTVLIQRANRKVRTLRGRYLYIRVVLTGDGRTSPQLAVLRAYASRFSYVIQYLPELYHEACLGADAQAPGSSTAADFLDRFLTNFESILTPLEDRIAQSYLLTDPRTTPADALEWLGSWIGISADPAYPVQHHRRLIQAAPNLYRWHGTLRGLKLALDIATGDAVTGGEIVVLEDFRLRRTFATILGADLADEDDPLLAGLAISGNSFVGDTLFLGDERNKEFLALFGVDLPKTQAEETAVAALFDRLAHRITVLVHQEVEPQDLGLIRRIVDRETPAHVQARILTASQPFIQGMYEALTPAYVEPDRLSSNQESYPFIVGAASLVAVDTYLATKPQPRPVKVGRSRLGVRDVIQRPPSLDPRLQTIPDPE